MPRYYRESCLHRKFTPLLLHCWKRLGSTRLIWTTFDQCQTWHTCRKWSSEPSLYNSIATLLTTTHYHATNLPIENGTQRRQLCFGYSPTLCWQPMLDASHYSVYSTQQQHSIVSTIVSCYSVLSEHMDCKVAFWAGSHRSWLAVHLK